MARVRIGGAFGDNATKVNGEYVVAGAQVNGAPAYQKQGDADQWLCRDLKWSWWVQDAASKGQAQGHAHTCGPAVVPWEADEWRVLYHGDFLSALVRVEVARTTVEEIAMTTEVPRSHAAPIPDHAACRRAPGQQ